VWTDGISLRRLLVLLLGRVLARLLLVLLRRVLAGLLLLRRVLTGLLLVLLGRVLARLLLLGRVLTRLLLVLLRRVLTWLLLVLTGLLLVLLGRVLARLLLVLLRRVLLLLHVHGNLSGLLGHNNGGLGLSRRLHVGNLFVVEVGLHHEVTGRSALEHELNALLNGASLRENGESHVGVTEGLTVEHILVTNFNVDVLVQLVQLFDGDLHVLELPLGVLAAVDADLRAPLLVLTDLDPDEGILLVHGATAVDIEVSAVN